MRRAPRRYSAKARQKKAASRSAFVSEARRATQLGTRAFSSAPKSVSDGIPKLLRRILVLCASTPHAISTQRRSSKLTSPKTPIRKIVSRRVKASPTGFYAPFTVLLVVVAVVAVVVAIVAIPPLFEQKPLELPPLFEISDNAPTSTPRDEWKRGSVPYLYQIDKEWRNLPYAGGTIAQNACGPTCLAMVYIALTGDTSMGPVAMAAFSERAGFVSDNMTSWALMSDGASTLGLTSEVLPATANAVNNALSSGKVIVASVEPGDFTTIGHFIVIAGLNADGSIDVHDPNSEERSHKSWDVQRVLNQCANLWAFS